MRLRDAAITIDDYDLWKAHEVASINQETSVCDWEGGETLLATGLTLVCDNRQAGAINGKRLAATARCRKSVLTVLPPRKLLSDAKPSTVTRRVTFAGQTISVTSGRLSTSEWVRK